MKACKDISTVVEQYLCCTCGACYAACGFDAIRFHETSGGYVFPEIDYHKCTACGLCYQVCPGLQLGPSLRADMPADPFRGRILSAWIGRARDENLFKNSQSGGLASALLAALFEDGRIDAAVVAVMRSGVPPRGEVRVIRSATELTAAQKSKYTPIPLLNALKEVQQQELRAAVVGLPCHMHGLQNLLDVKPILKPLVRFKLGLVCEHILLTTAIDYFGRRAGVTAVRDFVFKDKSKPKYPGNSIVTDIDGKETQLDDSLRRGVKDFFTPLRCRLCFDKLNVYADAVAADPHGLTGVDRRNGETLLMIRNENGQKMLDAAVEHHQVEVRAADPEAAVHGQGMRAKKQDWSGYMNSWRKLGYALPEYNVKTNPEAGGSNYRRSLVQAIKLDSFGSKRRLFRQADRYLYKKAVRKKIRSILRRVCGVMKQ